HGRVRRDRVRVPRRRPRRLRGARRPARGRVRGRRDRAPAAPAHADDRAALRRLPRRCRGLAAAEVTYVLAVALGLVAGVLAGLFGVGGGILFVPTLVALGLDHHEATGTSLLAIVPTVLVGTWRQARYGNVRVRPALVIGISAAAAAQGGVLLAVSLSDAPL